MEFIGALWMPILLSAVLVFFVSFLIHMVFKYHHSDMIKRTDDGEIQDALRRFNLKPGDHMIPCVMDMKDMKSPEFVEKLNKGPVVLMTVLPSGTFKMGKSLSQWFLFCVLVSLFSGYLGYHALSGNMNAPYLMVFRFVGCAAFMGYSFATITNSIWMGKRWSSTWKHVFDGLIYGLVTAGTFGWLWPRMAM